MIRKVKKGRHWSFPFTIKRIGSVVAYRIRFDESAKYVIEGLDKYDWNKLIGIKANFFSPRKNSLMVGWRANQELQQLEFTMYGHNEEGEAMFEDRPLIVLPYSELEYGILVEFAKLKLSNKIRVTIDTKHSSVSDFFYNDILRWKKKWWLITHWMGGTTPAVQDITIKYIERN